MTTFQTIHGLKLAGSNGQKSIVRTPEGRAFGSLPNRAVLNTYREEFIAENGLGVRNRAMPDTVAEDNYTGHFYQFGTFPNGAEGFDAGADPDTNPLSVSGTVDIDPERWSMFFVYYQENGGYSARQLMVSPVDEGTDDVVTPHIGVGSDLKFINVYENNNLSSGQPTRASYSVPAEERTPIRYVMVTFSVEHGVSLYYNGKLVDSDETDKRPLDTSYKAGEYQILRRTDGILGTAGIYNMDLSAPENAGYRAAIDEYVKNHFGAAVE